MKPSTIQTYFIIAALTFLLSIIFIAYDLVNNTHLPGGLVISNVYTTIYYFGITLRIYYAMNNQSRTHYAMNNQLLIYKTDLDKFIKGMLTVLFFLDIIVVNTYNESIRKALFEYQSMSHVIIQIRSIIYILFFSVIPIGVCAKAFD